MTTDKDQLILAIATETGVADLFKDVYTGHDLMKFAKRLLESQLSDLWIKFSDARPPNMENVLWTDQSGQVGLGYYLDSDADEWEDCFWTSVPK